MKVRTKKLLSILLAASMVFSLNITAMGAQPAEEVESPVVILTTGSQEEYGRGYDEGYDQGEDAGYDDGYFSRGYNNYVPYENPEPNTYEAGYNEGYAVGYNDGYTKGQAARQKDSWEEETDDYSDFPDEITSTTQLYSDEDLIVRDKDGKATTKVVVDGGKVTITGLNFTDPVSLNKTSIGKQVIETILCAGEQKKDAYLVNKKDVNVSQNMAGYIDGSWWNENNKVDNWESDTPSYYDVIKLDTGNYLFVAYGNRLAWVEGEPDQIPVWEYTGQKYVPYKSGKDHKSKAEALVVEVALVKADGSTVEKIPGATASAKVKGNTKDASVSGEFVPIKDTKVYEGIEYKDAIFDEYVKGGAPADLPTFTLKVKATGDAKADAKAIKAAIKDKTYKFAIRQRVITVGVPSGAQNAAVVTKNSLSFNDAEDNFWYDDFDDLDEKELGFYGGYDFYKHIYGQGFNKWRDSGIVLTKYNGKKATLAVKGWDFKDKAFYNKVDAKKDYVLKTDGALGASATPIGYIDEFKNNFVYSMKEGYYKYGYKLAFRVSPTDKKLLRGGIYKDGDNGFVYSED